MSLKDKVIFMTGGSRGIGLSIALKAAADGAKIAIAAKTAELATEKAWNDLRTKRNRRLTETDYLALSDVTLSTEMAEYRQALRDLPANTSDPANPTWPVKPS